jgi:hypothetical protein
MHSNASQMPPQSAAGAVGMVHTGLDYLAAADLHALGTDTQGQVLKELAAITAQLSAVQGAVLAVFDAAGGPEQAGCRSAATWLARNTQATKSAAKSQQKWSRIQQAHPAVAEAMSSGQLSESFARQITDWTRTLPGHMREGSDQILTEAALGGCGIRELKLIYARLRETWKSSRPDPGDDGDDQFQDRSVYLTSTLDGAGRLTGDLTPHCAASLQAVLDALGKRCGPEDLRTPGQRQHDALAEALAILLRSRQLPDRAGADTVAQVDVPLGVLRQMDGASAFEEAWLRQHGSPGEPAFLSGTDAEAAACDAVLIPVLTAAPDWKIPGTIIEVVLAHLCPATTPRALTAGEWAGLQYLLAKLCLDFCSGPRGAAAVLRAAMLTGADPAPPVSLPPDIGRPETIPAWMRRAIIARDRHCQWPGGCDAPPARCDIHHITPRSKGGPTSLANCWLYCKFHHLIVIHRWGWTVTVHPGGIHEAISPDGTTVYRSHAPPARPAA